MWAMSFPSCEEQSLVVAQDSQLQSFFNETALFAFYSRIVYAWRKRIEYGEDEGIC
jgi:hypothetical protein